MNRMEKARLDLGMSHRQLAEAIVAETGHPISERTLRDMETGARVPQPSKAKLVASYLGMAASELVADLRAHAKEAA